LIGTVLVVLLVLALLGAPVFPYSARWGWYGSGGLVLLVLILLVLVLAGRL
jgi:protein-S-isoprenylcysteine O-methyltransferase Ste14